MELKFLRKGSEQRQIDELYEIADKLGKHINRIYTTSELYDEDQERYNYTLINCIDDVKAETGDFLLFPNNTFAIIDLIIGEEYTIIDANPLSSFTDYLASITVDDDKITIIDNHGTEASFNNFNDTYIAEIELLRDDLALVDENLTSEVNRATEAEQTLNTAILSESSRATTKEGELNTAITEETVAREQGDLDLGTRITQEIYRATEAEDELQENIDAKQDILTAGDNITIENNVISADIDASIYATKEELNEAVEDLEDADTTLQANIDAVDDKVDDLSADVTTLEGRVDTAESDIDTLESDLDTEEAVRAQGDNGLSMQIMNLDNKIAKKEDKLTAGTNIRIFNTSSIPVQHKIECTIDTSTFATKTELESAVDDLEDSITAEETARASADATLQDNIDLKADQTDLTQEISDRTTGDTTLDAKIDEVDGKLDEAIEDFTTELDNKVDKVNGKGLSTNDYTTTEKNKLAGLSNYDDTEVRGLITSESSARSSADDDLQDQIDNKVDKLTTGYMIHGTSAAGIEGQYIYDGSSLSSTNYHIPASNLVANELAKKVSVDTAQRKDMTKESLVALTDTNTITRYTFVQFTSAEIPFSDTGGFTCEVDNWQDSRYSIIKATSLSTGKSYKRLKHNDTWDAWVKNQESEDTLFEVLSGTGIPTGIYGRIMNGMVYLEFNGATMTPRGTTSIFTLPDKYKNPSADTFAVLFENTTNTAALFQIKKSGVCYLYGTPTTAVKYYGQVLYPITNGHI